MKVSGTLGHTGQPLLERGLLPAVPRGGQLLELLPIEHGALRPEISLVARLIVIICRGDRHSLAGRRIEGGVTEIAELHPAGEVPPSLGPGLDLRQRQ
jgi:hypothetical protein